RFAGIVLDVSNAFELGEFDAKRSSCRRAAFVLALQPEKRFLNVHGYRPALFSPAIAKFNDKVMLAMTLANFVAPCFLLQFCRDRAVAARAIRFPFVHRQMMLVFERPAHV